MLQKSLWNEDTSVILAGLGSFLDDVAKIVDDVLDGLIAILALLRNDHEVGVGLESTLNC